MKPRNKKEKLARPVRVAANFSAWLSQVAQRLAQAEGRNVTLVEASARLGRWLTDHNVNELADLQRITDRLDKEAGAHL